MLPTSRTTREFRSRRSRRCAAALLLAAAGCAAPPGKAPSATRTEGGAGPATKVPALTAGTYCAHASLLERQGNFAGAEAHYRSALALQPDHLVALNRLGITLNKLGRHAEASESFAKAIAVHPDQAHLYNNLGFSLILEGRYTEAEKAARRALELRPRFARARMNHAVALAKLSRFDEAHRELMQVNGPADALYNLAMLQADSGAYEAAVTSLERSLVINPQRDDARRELEKLLARRLAATPAAVKAPATPAPSPKLAADATDAAAQADAGTRAAAPTPDADALAPLAADPPAAAPTPIVDEAAPLVDDAGSDRASTENADCGEANPTPDLDAPDGVDNAYFSGGAESLREFEGDDSDCQELAPDAEWDDELPAWFGVSPDPALPIGPTWFAEGFELLGAVEVVPAPTPDKLPDQVAPADAGAPRDPEAALWAIPDRYEELIAWLRTRVFAPAGRILAGSGQTAAGAPRGSEARD